MSTLFSYAKALVEKGQQTLGSGDVFAKVLSRNDDSGRHGVLIPTDAYAFFPELSIPDPRQNSTIQFSTFNGVSGSENTVAYKYYARYPERRITRLPKLINDVSSGSRILVFVRARHHDGTIGYYFDCANSATGTRFADIFHLVFGDELSPIPGIFVVRAVDSGVFSADPALIDLLERFDNIKAMGWVKTMRAGDTGIGYTFETHLGIKENNDPLADFRGIEIKCKGVKEILPTNSTKVNLFQAGPIWETKATAKERIRTLGNAGPNGLYSCFSQLTVTPNNLGLLLEVLSEDTRINLRKSGDALGHWTFALLEKRLVEKHSRSAFVKAKTRGTGSATQYSYEELVYCDSPSIDRFVNLVTQRNIVFEFTMSEKDNGTVRNHGYPWRLIRAEFLEQLFTFKIQLR